MRRKHFTILFLSLFIPLLAFSQIEIDTRSMLREMEREQGREYNAFALPQQPGLLFQHDFLLEEERLKKEKQHYLTVPLAAYSIKLQSWESLDLKLNKAFRFTAGLNWHYNIALHRWEYLPAFSFAFTF